jgi:hypothetical protein
MCHSGYRSHRLVHAQVIGARIATRSQLDMGYTCARTEAIDLWSRYSATREQAMTDFKEQWLGCLSGHSLARLDREVLKYLLLQTPGVAVANHFRRSSSLIC